MKLFFSAVGLNLGSLQIDQWNKGTSLRRKNKFPKEIGCFVRSYTTTLPAPLVEWRKVRGSGIVPGHPDLELGIMDNTTEPIERARFEK